jgi:hypothetical protein
VVLVGTVEPGSETMSGRSDWLRVIEAHPQLSRVPAVEGINPFTRRPHAYTANPDTAQILKDAKQIGSIHWAMDGSRGLVVWSHPGYEEQVRVVAENVAARLGWQLVSGGAA